MNVDVSSLIWTRAVVCGVGIVLNSILIMASTKLKKTSQNVCSMLIVFDAVTVVIYSSGGIISLGTFFIFPSQILLKDCVPYQIVPLLGFTLNRMSIFTISLDRLFSIVFPMRYKNRNSFVFLCFYAMVTMAYTAINLFLVIREDFSHPNVSVWCSMGDLFQSLNGPISQSILAINIVSLLFYGLIWYKIQQNKKRVQAPLNTGQTQSYTEKMFRSLFAIMASILFGYIVASLIKTLISNVQFSPLAGYILTSAASLLSVITSGSQPLILYAFSKEYRLAMKQTIVCCTTVSSLVDSGNVRQQQQQQQFTSPHRHQRVVQQPTMRSVNTVNMAGCSNSTSIPPPASITF